MTGFTENSQSTMTISSECTSSILLIQGISDPLRVLGNHMMLIMQRVKAFLPYNQP